MFKNVTSLVLLVGISILIPGSAASGASLLADPDIVGWWTFDEGAGTVAADSSPNGNDATVFGGAAWVPGVYGTALEFDGTDDYVGTDQSFLSDAAAFTVACWLKGDVSGASRTGLIGQNDCIEYGFISSNTIQIWTPGGGSLNVPWPHDESQWHHIVAVGDGTALVVYIDGEEAGRGGSTTGSYGTSTFNVNIGGGGVYDGTGNWFTGQLDDVAIFTRAFSAEEVLAMLEGVSPPELAANPSPAEDAIDIPRDVTLSWTAGEFAVKHNVYLGTSFDDVNNADPSALVSEGQAGTEYSPDAVLEFGQTYYWQVDEVNGAPDNTVFAGNTWAFTVEPIAYPITNVTATASSFNAGMGPERTVDGSGLNEMDEHGTGATDMWLSGMGDPTPFIQYDFDKVYKLYELWVWNSNQLIESFIGLGAKDVVIEYTADGAEWTVLEGATQLAQAPGFSTYTPNNLIAFNGVQAKSVRITITSGYGMLPQFGLSEVRFFFIPTFAREPLPTEGAVTAGANVMLSWRSGREAMSHQVYLGTDAADLAQMGTTTETVYAANGLDYDTTYFWSITEVNENEAVSSYAGDVWSFITPLFGTVDDFEQYDDACNRIFFFWEDGLGHTGGAEIEGCDVAPSNGNGGGSIVGNDVAPFAEKTIVNGGSQSMPFSYDNNFGPSEATLTIPGEDWTASRVQTLAIAFRGTAANTGELYVKINNAKITYDRDPADIARAVWQAWNIDLTAVSGLQNVTRLTIGVDGASAAGMLYIDDIRLYPLAGELITPVDPGNAGLMALYTFEGNYEDSSGNGRHGTPVGTLNVSIEQDPIRGQVLSLPGGNDQFVEIGAVGISGNMPRTIACWAKADDTSIPDWTLIFGFTGQADGTGGNGSHFNIGSLGGPGGIGAHVWGWEETMVSDEDGLDWHHYAMTYDGTTIQYFADGMLLDTDPGKSNVRDLSASADRVHIGTRITQDSSFPGDVDNAVIYNRVLSAEEILWLAEITEPIHKPF